MDESKHVSNCLQHSLAISFRLLFGICGKELKVTDQMSQAELNNDITVFHVFAIGRKIVTPQNTGEIFTQYFQQYLGPTSVGDLEESIFLRSKTPCPKQVAVVFMAGVLNMRIGSSGRFLSNSNQGCSKAWATFPMILRNWTREMVTPMKSRRYFRIVEKEARQTSFMLPIGAVNRGPAKPPFSPRKGLVRNGLSGTSDTRKHFLDVDQYGQYWF